MNGGQLKTCRADFLQPIENVPNSVSTYFASSRDLIIDMYAIIQSVYNGNEVLFMGLKYLCDILYNRPGNSGGYWKAAADFLAVR